MKTAQEIQQAIAQSMGTNSYFQNPMIARCNMVHTSGVKMIAEMAEAYWLIDAIVSHQPEAMKHPDFREFQSWTLTVKDRSAVLTCDDGNGNVIIRQKIDFTTFPEMEVRIWIELGSIDGENPKYVMMLPEER